MGLYTLPMTVDQATVVALLIVLLSQLRGQYFLCTMKSGRHPHIVVGQIGPKVSISCHY